MPVSSILDYLSSGLTYEALLKEFSFLEKEDIMQALAFSSTLMEDNFIASILNHEIFTLC